MKGISGVSTETRMKILRLLENMTGGTALIESMHGAGSPQSQRVMYQRLGKLPEKMKMAKKLAKVRSRSVRRLCRFRSAVAFVSALCTISESGSIKILTSIHVERMGL